MPVHLIQLLAEFDEGSELFVPGQIGAFLQLLQLILDNADFSLELGVQLRHARLAALPIYRLLDPILDLAHLPSEIGVD